MHKTPKFDSIQPRHLRYRSHYKLYLVVALTLAGLILAFWGHRLTLDKWETVYAQFHIELWLSLSYFVSLSVIYFFWLRKRLDHSVQVFDTHVLIHHGKQVEEIKFEDVESVSVVGWSIFYFKMKDGVKHYFNSGLERVDYIWDGLNQVRQDLFQDIDYEAFRLKLVQYDHHQKRKEWFFRHKMVDVFNWIFLPVCFLFLAYAIQSRSIVINQQGLYFFRLFMYSMLIILITTSFYSLVLKKFIFDKRIKIQMSSQPDDKLRDLEFEGIIIQRSKIMQMITACFIFALVVKSEMNLISLTKIKDEVAQLNIKKGETLVVDNRYNCVNCLHSVGEGDIVVFGKGFIGQVMAVQGDMVGQISQDRKGRVIASENVQEVPVGYVALKVPNQSEVEMVRLGDLIGKIQK